MSARKLSMESKMTLPSFGGPAATAPLADGAGDEASDGPVARPRCSVEAGAEADPLGLPSPPGDVAPWTGGASLEHAPRSATAAAATAEAERLTTRWSPGASHGGRGTP